MNYSSGKIKIPLFGDEVPAKNNTNEVCFWVYLLLTLLHCGPFSLNLYSRELLRDWWVDQFHTVLLLTTFVVLILIFVSSIFWCFSCWKRAHPKVYLFLFLVYLVIFSLLSQPVLALVSGRVLIGLAWSSSLILLANLLLSKQEFYGILSKTMTIFMALFRVALISISVYCTGSSFSELLPFVATFFYFSLFHESMTQTVIHGEGVIYEGISIASSRFFVVALVLTLMFPLRLITGFKGDFLILYNTLG